MPHSESSQVPIGTVLEGKFRVTQEIGRGGMAAVYEAENVDIGKRVAVKILSAELTSSRIVRERFIREARAAAAIHSPYICEVYDSGMFHDQPFLVMELLEGESLYDRMTRVRQFKVSTTLKIISHVVKGLARAHEAGVVHRDLKPENIFLTRDAEGRLLAKIVDFGLAKFYEGRSGDEEQNVRLTREGALFGTPAYMSPEQARGQGEVDGRADLWALGCIVYECLTGQTVWDVQEGVAMILAQIARGQLPDPRALRPDLPPSFVEWFKRALHPDLQARFQTGHEFMEALESSLIEIQEPPSSLNASPFQLDQAPVSSGGSMALSGPRPEPAQAAASSSSARALGVLLIASLFTLSGYAAWLYVLHPPTRDTEDALPASLSRTEEPPPRPLAEKGPGAEAIAQAQELFRQDQPSEALALLRAARGENPHVAGSLIAHTEVALKPTGPCQLAGMGRPRPFSVQQQPASYPRLALGPEGVLIAWSDAHQDPKRRNIYATLLDDSLRRVGAVRNVSPEASLAISPHLTPVQEGFATLYWDSGNREPGVYARTIESDGRILSPARLISKERKDKYFPSFVGLPGGEFLAIWSEQRDASKRPDLVVRRLNQELVPSEPILPLTSLLSGSATQPAADVADGKLFVAYRYQATSGMTEIRLLRIPLDDPALREGLTVGDGDQSAGESITLRAFPRQVEPALSCDSEGCLVVWDDETAGVFAASIPHNQSAALWHRDFASSGRRPTIARAPSGRTAIAYYAGERVYLVPVSSHSVGQPSIISRVSGFQPSPHLIAGRAPGEWLLAWRDFEAGHLEVFVARAQCHETEEPF